MLTIIHCPTDTVKFFISLTSKFFVPSYVVHNPTHFQLSLTQGSSQFSGLGSP